MKMNLIKMAATLAAIMFCYALADAKELQDVVYLKNGSIIRGTIVEQIPEQSLKIETSDGSIFVYETNEVARIAKEPPYKNKTNKTYRHSGYRGFIDTGGAVGVGDYGDPVFSFSTSHGYQFGPYFFIGAGLGVDYHFDWETAFMPIFADLRGYFINGKVTPFIGAKAGYSPLKNGEGTYFNPNIGASFFVSDDIALNITVGYNLQHTKMYHIAWNVVEPWYTWEIIGAIIFKVGIEF